MPKFTIGVIILVIVAYLVGVKYPMYGQKALSAVGL